MHQTYDKRNDEMKFEQLTEKCNIPYGVYHLDHDYINSIRETEPNAIDPEKNDVYCGPVYHATSERGVFGFFVPVDVKKFEKSAAFMAIFENGVYADVLDFKKMLPVVDDRFVTPVKANGELCAFCDNGKNDFEICAAAMISAQKNKSDCPRMMF